MATLQNIYSGYVFSGNPVILDIPAGRTGSVVNYIVRGGSGHTIFEGHAMPPISLNFADVIEAAVDFIPDVPEGNTLPVVNVLDNTGDFSSRYFVIYVTQDNTPDDSFTLVAFPGGVSTQNFRRYAAEKTDVFQARLLNHSGNFFMTNYSDDWLIVMRETEISPLYFISEGEMIIEVRDLLMGYSEEFECDPCVNALDVAMLRRRFYELHRFLPAQFDVMVNGIFSCRILIRESEPRTADYRLIFRNSFGVKERMELSQDLEISPEAGEKEISTRYDPTTDTSAAVAMRTPVGMKATAHTPVLDPGEISRLFDLLSSEDVWLEGIAPQPVKVIVTADDLSFPALLNEPKIFTINIEFAETTDFPTPMMSTTAAGQRPRRFSDTFDIRFS